jgi:hypothetical protein
MSLRNTGRNAKSELLEQLIRDTTQEIEGASFDEDEAKRVLAAHDEQEVALSTSVQNLTAEIQQLETARRESWNNMVRRRSRVVSIDQLLDRFDLLMRHYQSDLDRLSFISEGEYLLSQLGDAHCPLCGHLLDEHTRDQVAADDQMQNDMQGATRVEAGKIRLHMADLEQTVGSLRNEKDGHQAAIDEIRETINGIDTTIRNTLQPRLQTSYQQLLTWSNAKQSMALRDAVRKRIADLTDIRNSLGAEAESAEYTSAEDTLAIDAGAQRLFCDSLEALLRDWRFPNIGTVDIGAKSEIMIAGRPRASEGKGYKAVIHAAFTVALMRFARTTSRKHPCVSVIDSPLTCFKAKDQYTVEDDVQLGFYRSLMQTTEDEQVIILENNLPPAEVVEELYHEHFTGGDTGRRGFYPATTAPPPQPIA